MCAKYNKKMAKKPLHSMKNQYDTLWTDFHGNNCIAKANNRSNMHAIIRTDCRPIKRTYHSLPRTPWRTPCYETQTAPDLQRTTKLKHTECEWTRNVVGICKGPEVIWVRRNNNAIEIELINRIRTEDRGMWKSSSYHVSVSVCVRAQC